MGKVIVLEFFTVLLLFEAVFLDKPGFTKANDKYSA
jgi:hypothetical protein